MSVYCGDKSLNNLFTFNRNALRPRVHDVRHINRHAGLFSADGGEDTGAKVDNKRVRRFGHSKNSRYKSGLYLKFWKVVI